MDLLAEGGALRAGALASALRTIGFELGEGDLRESDRVFYDTFDGRVRAAGCSAVDEGGGVVLVDRETGVEREDRRGGGRAPAPELERIVGVRALLPLVRVHSRASPFAVLDGERKTVVRITLERPTLVSAGGRRTALRPRLRIAGVRGYDSERARVRAALVGELECSEETLVDEAVRVAGGQPAGISSKVEVALAADQRADAAVAAVLGALLDVISSNFEGAIVDVDPEFLHDLRVAVRRSRAVLRELRGVFPPVELGHFRTELRWLQRASGDARDLDVHVLEFDSMRALVPPAMAPELDPLLAVLRERRRLAHRELASVLGSERTNRLRAEWAAFLEELVGLPVENRVDAERPIGSLTGERIRKVHRRMLKLGRAIDSSSPPEDYHELRKQGKELRYLLELFGAHQYPDRVVEPMIESLKALQDVLGRHQDREVQAATLRSLREQVAVLPDGAAAVMAMGAMVAALSDDEARARAQFAKRFKAFAAQRRLVKEAFG
ncbi:MAG: hypothetical protein DLM64_02410 [Solirubrobacterales bacterium]|nr:MAG: hypothetical protein DLM64_02410 [Solirubrobacterales bacterium]